MVPPVAEGAWEAAGLTEAALQTIVGDAEVALQDVLQLFLPSSSKRPSPIRAA